MIEISPGFQCFVDSLTFYSIYFETKKTTAPPSLNGENEYFYWHWLLLLALFRTSVQTVEKGEDHMIWWCKGRKFLLSCTRQMISLTDGVRGVRLVWSAQGNMPEGGDMLQRFVKPLQYYIHPLWHVTPFWSITLRCLQMSERQAFLVLLWRGLWCTGVKITPARKPIDLRPLQSCKRQACLFCD